MKKLVKTAKQQFEERLSKLTLIKKYAFTDTDLYYLCEDNSHEMSILREINDEEFYEQKYAMSYSELISSEEFLHEMTMRFIEHHDEPVKPLFDWYASADKDDEPFTLDDIWMCSLEDRDLSEVIHDLYEEVPDVSVITAKEQFEQRLIEFGLFDEWVRQGSVGRIGAQVANIGIIIFVHEDYNDKYSECHYPNFSELRKDSRFKTECLDEFGCHEDDKFVIDLTRWLSDGENCPLYPVDVYFPANHLMLDSSYDFEDKYTQSIEQMIKLTPEQQDAVKAFEDAAKALNNVGVKIISYYDENEFYVINGNANLEFENIFGGHEGEYPGFKSISKALTEKHSLNFSWDLYWGFDYDFCAKPL